MSTRLGVVHWLIIAGRKGMPCPHTTVGLIRPWLLASCSPDAAATVPSMGSLALSEEPLALSEEPLARGGSAVPRSTGYCCSFARKWLRHRYLLSACWQFPLRLPPSRLVRQVRKPQPWSSHPCLSPSRHASPMRPMLLAPSPSLALLPCQPPSR